MKQAQTLTAILFFRTYAALIITILAVIAPSGELSQANKRKVKATTDRTKQNNPLRSIMVKRWSGSHCYLHTASAVNSQGKKMWKEAAPSWHLNCLFDAERWQGMVLGELNEKDALQWPPFSRRVKGVLDTPRTQPWWKGKTGEVGSPPTRCHRPKQEEVCASLTEDIHQHGLIVAAYCIKVLLLTASAQEEEEPVCLLTTLSLIGWKFSFIWFTMIWFPAHWASQVIK